MRGYVKVLQWYGGAKSLDELNTEAWHTGDAASIDSLLGFEPPPLLAEEPLCDLGCVVFRVEDDGSLTMVAHRYDTSG